MKLKQSWKIGTYMDVSIERNDEKIELFLIKGHGSAMMILKSSKPSMMLMICKTQMPARLVEGLEFWKRSKEYKDFKYRTTFWKTIKWYKMNYPDNAVVFDM